VEERRAALTRIFIRGRRRGSLRRLLFPEQWLPQLRNVDYHNRDVIGLGVRFSIARPREYFLEQALSQLVGREILVLIDEIFQPELAKFQPSRIGSLDQPVRVYQKSVTGLQRKICLRIVLVRSHAKQKSGFIQSQ
jgi:hypothetical protein